jgi:hypothetical protein
MIRAGDRLTYREVKADSVYSAQVTALFQNKDKKRWHCKMPNKRIKSCRVEWLTKVKGDA